MRQSSVFFIAFLSAFLTLLISCKKDPPPAPPVSQSAPTISSFTPTQGPEGAAVEIAGDNFTIDKSKVKVYFNGKAAEVVSATTTSITTIVPAGATSGKITVDVNGKSATSSSDFIVNAAAPSIANVSPDIAAEGETIEISGTNFRAGAKVYIGAIEATTTVFVSPTKITAVLPVGVTTAKVKVVISGLEAESPQPLFIKPTITSVSPLVAPVDAIITISGTNFIANELLVRFGNIIVDASLITVVSSTQIKVKVPAGLSATPVKISVTTKGQLVESTEHFTLLQLTSFTPSAKGGESITITGSGFSATPAENVVKITGVAAVVTTSTLTSLTVTVPMGASSGYITVSRDGYTVTSIDRFHYQFVSTVSSYAGGMGILNNPSAIVIDRHGNMFVADQYHHVIRKITGGVVTTFAGDGTPGYHNGQGTAAKFNFPTGLAVDNAGNLYVADLGNQLIRKISPVGLVSTLAGEVEKSGSVDGLGSAARFNSPKGLAVDNASNVYVADAANHLIRKISPAGEVITFAGQAGVGGSANGAGTAATFKFPAGIAIDANGTLYVADEGNHAIRKITASAVVTTHAGTGLPGHNDGTGSAAAFNHPNGIVIHFGTLYVTDASNHLIRSVSSAGVVTTVAGMAGVPGNDNGPTEAARFHNPSGVAVDPNGLLYVADKSNHLIRKISPQ